GICNEKGEILVQESIPTQVQAGNCKIVENICTLARFLCVKLKIKLTDCYGMGIGVPGMIDSSSGEVIFAGNLGFDNFNLKNAVMQELKIPVVIANDANVAALGEAKFGAGKNYKDSVLITLGTGVGGGIIINGKIFAGNRSAGAEIGHMIININGNQCTCGLKGCYEAYASASALIKLTKEKMEQNKNSVLWNVGLDKIDGATAFKYASIDETAKQIVEEYLDYVAVGLVNVANVFRPQIILLGGGISNEGDNLVIPLRERLNKMIFAGDKGPKVELSVASLKNKAGLLGACALIM
ncbi:MAG TPA: glucokinase, partial [Clostridiales bacterium]|nr:glucokinase [Clostridiales bacterium]